MPVGLDAAGGSRFSAGSPCPKLLHSTLGLLPPPTSRAGRLSAMPLAVIADGNPAASDATLDHEPTTLPITAHNTNLSLLLSLHEPVSPGNRCSLGFM